MNHKRQKPKQTRAGCTFCKPHKNSHNRTAERARARRQWQKHEHAGS